MRSAGAVACALALANVPAEASQVRAVGLPDALTVADSARGAVLATCLRANTLTTPALFRVERRLGGAIPDTFTAYPARESGPGQFWLHFRAGERNALLLRDAPPPVGPEFRRAFRWRDEAQFGIWHWARPGPSFDDSTAAAVYSGIMGLASLSRPEQVSTLARWVSAGEERLLLVEEVVERHPEVWGEPLRDSYLEQLRHGAARMRRKVAMRLALHPDTTTRTEFLRLAQGDSLGWELALSLGSTDRTPWVRRTVVALGEKTLGSLSGPAPNLGESIHSGWWQGALSALDALTAALLPDDSESERQMLIRVARLARPSHWMRYAALRRLGGDTTRVVRDLIWETVRGDSAGALTTVADAPEPDELTRYWTTEELHRALQDRSSIVRVCAYREVARRRDLQAADTILVWLRQNRVPGETDIAGHEAGQMLRTLGDTRSPAALADLMAWGEIPEDYVREAVMDAVQSFGDRRAAPFFRRLALAQCARLERLEMGSGEYRNVQMQAYRVAAGLAALGDESDADVFVRWARDCPGLRRPALEAIGILAGVPRMVEVIRQVETEPMKPEQARDYELLETTVHERIAQRRRADVR